MQSLNFYPFCPCRGVKNFENTLVDLNVADAPKIGSRSVCGTWLALRSEIIQMLELKQKVVKRQGTSTPASSADNRKKASKQKVNFGDVLHKASFIALHTSHY